MEIWKMPPASDQVDIQYEVAIHANLLRKGKAVRSLSSANSAKDLLYPEVLSILAQTNEVQPRVHVSKICTPRLFCLAPERLTRQRTPRDDRSHLLVSNHQSVESALHRLNRWLSEGIDRLIVLDERKNISGDAKQEKATQATLDFFLISAPPRTRYSRIS